MKKYQTLLCTLIIALSANAAGITAIPANVEFNFEQPTIKHLPTSTQAAPINLSIKDQTYNSASYTWFYYLETGMGFSNELYDSEGQFIAAITWTYEAYQYCAYLDGIAFADDEIEYYCSTYWILNSPEGFFQGSAWDKNVTQVTDGTNSINALKPGSYYLRIRELDESGFTNSAPAQTSFTLTESKVENLKVNVAADNKTATLTWTQPTLAKDTYVYLSVLSGSMVAYDNYEGDDAVSPLTIDVEEGRTYNVTAQVIERYSGTKLGSEEKLSFTVGKNLYTPLNPIATVTDGDQVHFSWTAEKQADYYRLQIFKDGELYGTTSSRTSELDRDLETGTYTWSVAAFEIGDDDLYYPVSDYVEGNSFTTQSAELPTDAINLNVWHMEAGYYTFEDKSDPDYREGYHVWIIMFGTGTENSTGLPSPWFTIYSTREAAISGKYSVRRDNVSLGNCFMYVNALGGEPDNFATDAELTLNFDGFYQPYVSEGYHYGTYSGSFKMTTDDGKTYVATFNNLFCQSYHMEYVTNPSQDYIGMYDEEESPNAIENVFDVEARLDINRPMYNVVGQRVDATYHGIVIQNGKKYLLK